MFAIWVHNLKFSDANARLMLPLKFTLSSLSFLELDYFLSTIMEIFYNHAYVTSCSCVVCKKWIWLWLNPANTWGQKSLKAFLEPACLLLGSVSSAVVLCEYKHKKKSEFLIIQGECKTIVSVLMWVIFRIEMWTHWSSWCLKTYITTLSEINET